MYLVLIVSLLWEASNAQEICTADATYIGLKWYREHVHFNWECIIKLRSPLTTDLLTQAITQSPHNYLPRPGMCGTIRPLPRAQAQQLNRNGTVLFFNTLQNQLNAPFCLGLIANTVKEPTLLYIYDNLLIQVGNLTVRGDSIVFNLNGQDAFLPGNFSGFAQLQLCANGTHINLYVGCQFSMAVQFSASGVSEMAVISLFTPFLSSTPQFDVSCSRKEFTTHLTSCSLLVSFRDVSNSCIFLAALELFQYRLKSMPSALHSLLIALYLLYLSLKYSRHSQSQPQHRL